MKLRASAGKHARTRPGSPAAQRHNDQFGTQWKRHLMVERPIISADLARGPRPAIVTLRDWRFKARAP